MSKTLALALVLVFLTASSIIVAVNWTSYSLDGQQNITFSGNTNMTDISNGLHNITVYAQDTFGNIGSSQTISFTIAKPESESFPVVPVAAVSIEAVALLVAGLLVYHKKHKAKTFSQEAAHETTCVCSIIGT